MSTRPQRPPLDRMAEALVLADTVDVASIEELDRSAAAVQRWAAKHARAETMGVVDELAKAARTLRRYPDRGPRALEQVGDLFCRVDRLLGSDRLAAPSVDRSEPASDRRADPDRRSGHGRRAADPPAATSAEQPGAAPQLRDDPDLLADFVTRALEHVDNAEEQLIALEQRPEDREALNATFRAFHTIKGMAGFLSLQEIQSLAHSTESILDGPRHGEGALGPAVLQQLFEAVDATRTLVTALGDSLQDSPDPESTSMPAGGTSDDEPDGNGWKPDSVAPQSAVTRTVRVDEDRLDRLLDSIGELVIAESMVSEGAKSSDGEWGALAQHFSQLDKITRRLQEMATSLRMVPLKSTMRRMARQARDMSASAGKPVDFTVIGEDTELDKEMVDRLADPLTHLLRNAVDHGLEPPAERRAVGKPERGHIEIHAYHRGGTINIEVSDDGRGLDLGAVLATARDRGLVRPDEVPGDRELLQLIFAPGFSTAKTVTDVSGRGVGMDVVQRVVEGLRGNIEVTSEPGRGTRFTIKLPLTLAIIDGMVLRVAEERYVVPLASIERSVRPRRDQMAALLGGKGEMLDLGDGLVPVVRLDRLFGIGGALQDPTDAVIVVINEGDRRTGLLVCELLGQQQTVIKPLGDAFHDAAGLTGGAIMPDGRVGLILDVVGLVQYANSRGGE